MEIQSMLPGYLDVLYSGRNKAYGGYELRVHYPQRVRNGVLYAFLGTAIVLAFVILAGRSARELASPAGKPIVLVYPVLPVLPAVAQPPVVEMHHGSASASSAHVHSQVVTPPVIVTDRTPDPQLLAPIQAGAQPGLTTSAGIDVPTGSGPGSGNGPGINAGRGMNTGAGSNKPYAYVEQMPVFVGDMGSYLNANMHYPETAREAGTTGRVIIKFIVNEDGSISGAEVVRGIGNGCDEEALRVIRNMPKWKPGRQNGRAVKVYFMLPVMFVLQ